MSFEMGSQALDGDGANSSITCLSSVLFTVFIGAIPAALHAIVFAYIWSSSRSLAVVTVYHAAYDGTRDSLALIIGLGAMTNVWVNLFLIILGTVFFLRGNWQGLRANISDAAIPGIGQGAA